MPVLVATKISLSAKSKVPPVCVSYQSTVKLLATVTTKSGIGSPSHDDWSPKEVGSGTNGQEQFGGLTVRSNVHPALSAMMVRELLAVTPEIVKVPSKLSTNVPSDGTILVVFAMMTTS